MKINKVRFYKVSTRLMYDYIIDFIVVRLSLYISEQCYSNTEIFKRLYNIGI